MRLELRFRGWAAAVAFAAPFLQHDVVHYEVFHVLLGHALGRGDRNALAELLDSPSMLPASFTAFDLVQAVKAQVAPSADPLPQVGHDAAMLTVGDVRDKLATLIRRGAGAPGANAADNRFAQAPL